ncbi:hypothetical protein [Lacticaseibacillus sharpeae]|nr:hypothetical protein [Lacticaseibacillus sharpeae]
MLLAVVAVVVLGAVIIAGDEMIDDAQTPNALRHPSALALR